MFWVADPFEDMVIAMKSLLKGKEKDTDMQNFAFNFVGSKVSTDCRLRLPCIQLRYYVI